MAGVQRIPDAFANENQQAQLERQDDEGSDPKPGSMQIGLALSQQLPE